MNCKCRRLRGGFTLMEVWVAIAVMSAGLLAMGSVLDFFNRMKLAERRQAQAFLEAVQQMEKLIECPPPCDSVVTLNPYVSLAWVDVFQNPEPPAHSVHFRRLVSCRR